MVIFRDFCCNSASFGLVSYDPCFPSSLAAKLNGLSLPSQAAVSADVWFYCGADEIDMIYIISVYISYLNAPCREYLRPFPLECGHFFTYCR